MAFREVPVFEVREVLRLWLGGEGIRMTERLAGVDRKTVRRYVEAAERLGLSRDSGEEQLSDFLLGAVVEAVRPHRLDGHGASWRLLSTNHDQITEWLDAGLTAVKVGELLARKGVVVPQRTLHRYAKEVCGHGRDQKATVRVADGEPGSELQVDFGYLGLVFDPESNRQRRCHALVFCACYSRHCFVWLTFSQNTEAVISGFEAAWRFFGGVFRIVIPDNLKAIVTVADATDPRFNQAFVEYAQARGFVIDPARVRRPQDKPRVERMVPFVRNSFFAGESFLDLADAQGRAEEWCRERAGMRIHRATRCRPAEVFALEEAERLGLPPVEPYDLPLYARAKVHRDHHIEVGRALYSVPGDLIGVQVEVRADRSVVKIFSKDRLVKVHTRVEPGHRSTDAADLPAEKTAYALRDLDHLRRLAASHGEAIGTYATIVLDHPLPWTKMRQVYTLLGLVKRWGAPRVESACRRALEAEAVHVPLIARMLERGTEDKAENSRSEATVTSARFARDPSHFATEARKRGGAA
jgi:transposase